MQIATDCRQVTLADRPLFPKCSSISYENFSNIYMWRDVMNYRIYEIHGIPCLTGQYEDHPTFCYLPKVSEDEKLRQVLEGLRCELGSPLLLRPLDSKAVEQILRLYPDAVIQSQRNLQDYIYLQSDLATLAGNKLHQKRNHVHQFQKKYHWTYVSIAPNQIPFLRDVAAHLFEVDPRLPDEYAAILQLLDHFAELELQAGVLLVDDTPVAYSIGEVMNEEMALIHVEKADRSFEGAYAMINQLFSQEFQGCTYINREEDMGIPGLRQAKSSYHPIRMGEYFAAKI